MDTCFSHTTAQQLYGILRGTVDEPVWLSNPPVALPSADPDEILDFAFDRQLSFPVHTLTSSKGAVHSTPKLIKHYFNPFKHPYSNLYRAPSGFFITSPQLTLLHITQTQSFLEGLLYAMELCGNYAKDNSLYPYRKCCPILTKEQLEMYCLATSGLKGIKNLRRLSALIQNNSYSIMETKLYLYLCLPPRMGGIGIHAAQLNPRIQLSYASATTYGIQEIRPDFFWDNHGNKLAVEYDSDTFHSTSAAINKDAKRRNILLSEGIENITLTHGQVIQFKQLNAIATTIANRLGMRLSQKPGTSKNYVLYRKLFKANL